MSSVSRWRDSGHLERAVATAGGREAFDAAVAGMLDDARGWRLAEIRKRRGMTREQVAVRMGISVARISQIEGGDVAQPVRYPPFGAPAGSVDLLLMTVRSG
jgi:DNA-binding XRE family transcriptional regulator